MPPTPPSRAIPLIAAATPSQAAYLTQTLVGLGEAGAPQVFVTLHDGGLDGEYATRGPRATSTRRRAATTPSPRRESFAAVHRLVDELGPGDGVARASSANRSRRSVWSREVRAVGDRRTVPPATSSARRGCACTSGQDDPRAKARAGADRGPADPPARPRPRARWRGRSAALLWKGAIARWHSQRALRARRGRRDPEGADRGLGGTWPARVASAPATAARTERART